MTVTINKSTALGTLSAPTSKSFFHRYAVLCAASDKTTVINGVTLSDDVFASLDCIKTLGATYKITDNQIQITGTKKAITEEAHFNCRESGSTLRFFMPFSALYCNSSVFTGSQRLLERGAQIYSEALCEHGVKIEAFADKITVSGKLLPGEYNINGSISSQYISGLLMTLPFLTGDSTLNIIPPAESLPYINITLNALKEFGIKINRTSDLSFFIKGNQTASATKLTVEGDWSNAAFLLALNAFGGNVLVTGLNNFSAQGDRIFTSLFNTLMSHYAEIDISNCPDLGPVLFSVAAAKHGGVFYGIKRLRLKESDRVKCMCDELSKFGIKTKADENKLIVYPSELKKPNTVLFGHNDHRIVMSLSLLLSLTGGSITGAEAVKKSYPDFFSDLSKLNIDCNISDDKTERQ